MAPSTLTSALVVRIIKYLAFASLLGSVVALPTKSTKATDALTQTGYKPNSLPKLSNYQFKNSHGPPTYHIISEEELAEFSQTSVPPAGEQAVGMKNRDTTKRNVIGADNRVLVHNTSFPYSAIGRILWSDGKYCTGTLVGDRIVATASHCVPWGQSGISMIFQPDFYDTNVYPSASVTDAMSVINQTTANFDSSSCGLENDFAILRLSTVQSGTLGGYFGATTTLTSSLTHEGYPSDLANGARPYQQTGLTATVASTLKCDGNGPLTTTADVSDGQSGGPLYIPTANYITGLLSAGTATSSIFASGNKFVSMVSMARTKWPA